MPPGVQAYLADLLDAPPKGKGRPAKHPGQLESSRFLKARALFVAIQEIRTAPTAEGPRRPLSEAKACAVYTEINKLHSVGSVVRRYRAAKKKMHPPIPRDGTGRPKWFRTHKDMVDWEKTNLKKVAKNK